MRRVNIYAEALPATFKKMPRAFGFIMELVDIVGETVQTTDGWTVEETTWNEAVLKAFVAALAKLRRPCEIHLYTQNKVVLDLFDNNLETWEKNGYRNARGEPVKNATLWELLSREGKDHLILTEEGVHRFYHWMMARLEEEKSHAKEKEQKHV